MVGDRRLSAGRRVGRVPAFWGAIGVALAHFATRGKWVEYGYRAIGGRGQAREENWLGQSVGGEDLWWRSPLGAGFRGSL